MEDKKVKFYYLNSEHPESHGGSITNYTGNANNSANLQCYKLKSLMSMNNHNKIDVLKMDIEGAAIEVMNNILDDNIFPEQIAVEFEVGENEDISEDAFQNFSVNIINSHPRSFAHNSAAVQVSTLDFSVSDLNDPFE